ncbi:MAG TPA: hypothetical protein PK668_03540 [Myxococcota bacterium]|nr:hypothetical protein [Myxococcota bacterium]HRY91929.1 hypothetical protein [Myxococcota bacterium]HSA22286.1 hypothetical protein [Myxococcota bacterium]
MASRAAGLLLLALALALPPRGAGAHAQYKPFSLNRFALLTFEAPGLHVRYDVTAGDVPAQRLRARLDADGDGVVSEPERLALLAQLRARVEQGLHLRLDERTATPEVVGAELELVSDQVELLAPLRLRLHLVLACGPGRHTLVYQDGAVFEELEQTELLVQAGPEVRLTRASRPPRERGVVPHMFWEQGEAPGAVWIQFERLGPGQAPAPGAPLADESNPLKRALADPALGLLGLLAALGLAFALGALHALSPGHGKTLVAAYLVGARGRVRHALLLGLVVSATHVAAVFALGLAALVASERALPERALPWIEVGAALLVAALGALMLLRRLRAALLHRLAHAQGAGHEHDHGHGHDHAHAHEHEHGHDQAPPAGVRTGELVWLGVTGGLVPCPSATVVLLMALYLGRVGLGLALLAAFSLGLAATLVTLGILVVKAQGLAARLAGPRFQAWSRWAPALSAGLILIIGAAMTVFALLRV